MFETGPREGEMTGSREILCCLFFYVCMVLFGFLSQSLDNVKRSRRPSDDA
jgi:hypothetical protein